MTDDEAIKAAEQRGYSKGYVAGRKRLETDAQIAFSREREMWRIRQQRFDRFYAAAMTGLLSGPGPWKRGDKVDSSLADYAATAKEIALEMLRNQP